MPPWRRKEKQRSDKDPPASQQNSPQGPSKAQISAIGCLRAVTRGASDPSKTIAAASGPVTSGNPAEKLEKQQAEFGPLGDPSRLYTSCFLGSAVPDPVVDEPPYRVILTTYISFLHLKPQNGYASLYNDFESFYTRCMKQRINDCFERPTTGVPRRQVVLLDRTTEDNTFFRLTGTATSTLNLKAAMVFSIGFAANSTLFPSLVENGCLILSDELNHASIRFGARLNMTSLEGNLREAISQGFFSMEGTMCNLPRILQLKKRYKFHFFIDDAYSMGAIGSQGRGVCDYFKAGPAEVDILMGTFTKPFGANGGYVAASKEIIDRLRCTNARQVYGLALSCMVTMTPIVPLMLSHPAKMPVFSTEMLRRKISVVVVTYPATPLELSRTRLCVSAAHTKDDIDRALKACDKVGEALQLKFSLGIAAPASKKTIEAPRWTLAEVIENGTKDVKLPVY
ncbi:pyridoxal phosphate-dependent transferase [Aspergillus pseudoustus]|uniref:Pyridoxal phosphate-dependent transferase n=1 Tax=Aspergillus pseudoustus TaxID=1810923 RepID=A0ABR4J8S4_9EURO